MEELRCECAVFDKETQNVRQCRVTTRQRPLMRPEKIAADIPISASLDSLPVALSSLTDSKTRVLEMRQIAIESGDVKYNNCRGHKSLWQSLPFPWLDKLLRERKPNKTKPVQPKSSKTGTSPSKASITASSNSSGSSSSVSSSTYTSSSGSSSTTSASSTSLSSTASTSSSGSSLTASTSSSGSSLTASTSSSGSSSTLSLSNSSSEGSE